MEAGCGTAEEGFWSTGILGTADGTGRASDEDLIEACLAGGLRIAFQPILDLRKGRVYAYEALSRGPVGSRAESADALFRLARSLGRAEQLELYAAQRAVERFAALDTGTKLFVNFSPAMLAAGREDPAMLLSALRRQGIAPHRLVIELTENGDIRDSSAAWNELLRCRSLGFGVAMDDLGEGFASLRLWSELRPEYVKVDKHFVNGISTDPLKLEMARAIQQIAQVAGASVIAEGVEEEADFQTVRDLGIRHGQGYLIGRPQPGANATACAVWKRLSQGPVGSFPLPGNNVNRVTVRRLMRPVLPAAPQADNDEMFSRFDAEPELSFIPVVEDGAPRGTVNRFTFMDRFARPYHRELYGKKSCRAFMNADPLVIEADASIQELSYRVAESGQRSLVDGFVVVENGRYCGVGSAQDLIREMTELQIAAARYANPLTLLPGNVPIAEHVERLLSRGGRFAVCYCDLDNFKPFNDVFGYQRGDEAIQLSARVLAEACDASIDFLGHIGGDDFVAILQSEDWEARCQGMLRRFAEATASLFSDDDRSRGGFLAEDRQGQSRVFPLLAISIGCVLVEPGTFELHSEVAAAAAEAKKLAKRSPGNSLFIERRRHPVSSLRPPAA